MSATQDQPAIRVRGLRKTYAVPERESGLRASVRSLWSRRTNEVVAVAGIDFAVAPGEVVGFLGPNGAGKTTTLKMLSGLLYPTAGEADVLGHVPWRREKAYLRQMTLVMGQRNQMRWTSSPRPARRSGSPPSAAPRRSSAGSAPPAAAR